MASGYQLYLGSVCFSKDSCLDQAKLFFQLGVLGEVPVNTASEIADAFRTAQPQGNRIFI